MLSATTKRLLPADDADGRRWKSDWWEERQAQLGDVGIPKWNLGTREIARAVRGGRETDGCRRGHLRTVRLEDLDRHLPVLVAPDLDVRAIRDDPVVVPRVLRGRERRVLVERRVRAEVLFQQRNLTRLKAQPDPVRPIRVPHPHIAPVRSVRRVPGPVPQRHLDRAVGDRATVCCGVHAFIQPELCH